MIESVHIPIYLESEAAKYGALLTLKTIRVGFPTKPISVHIHSACVNRDELLKICSSNGYHTPAFSGTNDSIIKWMVRDNAQTKGFAVIDSDVVFFENCEDFEPVSLIAGEFIPEFVCPISKAVTFSRLHTAFFVVSDPVKLRREIELSHRPLLPRFCPFDPFSPVVTFQDHVPRFHDSCSVLYHAIGGERFGPDMLKRFEHLYGGSYITTGTHAEMIKNAYDNPESARGFRKWMTKYFEDRKP